MQELTRRKIALFALFFVGGFTMATWIARTPSIRDFLGANTAEMGLILLGLSIGSVIGIMSSAKLVATFGSKKVILVGTLCEVLAMPMIALGAYLPAAQVVASGLMIFGLGMGIADVAINVEGGEIERLTLQPFLPQMHGFFSFGSAIGAFSGVIASAMTLPVTWHLFLAAVFASIILFWNIHHLPKSTGKILSSRPTGTSSKTLTLLKDRRLLMIGFIVLAMALAEGTAADWLPLIMVDGFDFTETQGSAVFTIFALSLTLGRFLGTPIIRALGRPKALMMSGICAAAGIAAVAFIDQPAIALAAVVLWGLGAALGFPVALSAAAESGANPAGRIAVASIIGYMAFLAGPPILGFLGEAFSLRYAILFTLLIVLLSLFVVPQTRSTNQNEPARTSE